MMRLVLELTDVPPALRESLRTCLAAHKLTLDEPILVEAGNNLAMALISISRGADNAAPPTSKTFDQFFGPTVTAENQMLIAESTIEWAKLFLSEWEHGEAHKRPTSLCEVATLCATLLHLAGGSR